MRLKLLKKGKKGQEQIIDYGILKQNCVCFRKRQRLTRFTIEKLIKFCSSKSKLSVYLNFSRLAIFSMKFYTSSQPFGTYKSFTIYSAGFWYNL